MSQYHGIVIEQSLRGRDVPAGTRVVAARQVGAWRFLLVTVPETEIEEHIRTIQAAMVTDDAWYAHFFLGEELVVVFRDASFRVGTEPATWGPAIAHGQACGIRLEQLDFKPRTVPDAEAFFGEPRFLGSVILESLSDPTPLQGLTPVLVRREEHPDDPDATVWNVRWYYLPEPRVRELAAALAQVMKRKWYAHFFNRRLLIVIMPDRVFRASALDQATWEPFVAYGETVGVEPSWTRRVPVRVPEYLRELGLEFDLG